MTACGRLQLRKQCVPEVYRIKYPKPQMYNKRCLEKEEGDTFLLKSFEILPFKSFVGFRLSKWQSRHNMRKKMDRRVVFFILATWVAIKLWVKKE